MSGATLGRSASTVARSSRMVQFLFPALDLRETPLLFLISHLSCAPADRRHQIIRRRLHCRGRARADDTAAIGIEATPVVFELTAGQVDVARHAEPDLAFTFQTADVAEKRALEHMPPGLRASAEERVPALVQKTDGADLVSDARDHDDPLRDEG